MRHTQCQLHRRTWWGTKNLLAARVHCVDAPRVTVERHAAEGAHGVDCQQDAVGFAHGADACQILVHARAALALQKPQKKLHDVYRLCPRRSLLWESERHHLILFAKNTLRHYYLGAHRQP